MNRIFVLTVLLFSSWALADGENEATVSQAIRDQQGLLIHEVASPYQAETTQIRVLLPDVTETSRRYAVVYVLPVEAQDETKYGDGLLEAKRHNLHNTHKAIFVAPTFSATPWYCDHVSDTTLRQESHFLNVVMPFVERTYPVETKRDGRLLLGFSKSGSGAWSLLLRHPELFERAAAWDAPLMLDKSGPWGSGPLFGSQKNFESYCVSHLVRIQASKLGESKRLFLLGYGDFREQHVRMHGLLAELKIPHEYRDGPKRKHDWHSDWLPEAVDFLLAIPEEKKSRS